MIDINRMKLGDVVRAPKYPKVTGVDLSTGVVVYIDPKKYFFTLEYTTESGVKLRESFCPYGPQACKD